MSSLTEITLTRRTECQTCGYVRTHIPQDGIIALNDAGFKVSAARDVRNTATGATFGHGGGYDVIDADLLDGDGSGALVKRLRDEHGITFTEAGTPRATTCRECAKYL